MCGLVFGLRARKPVGGLVCGQVMSMHRSATHLTRALGSCPRARPSCGFVILSLCGIGVVVEESDIPVRLEFCERVEEAIEVRIHAHARLDSDDRIFFE